VPPKPKCVFTDGTLDAVPIPTPRFTAR
jgi:hypothetical protein